jgi:hypothetical protein
MFSDISDDRVVAMTPKERRWFDNIKKAFKESDEAFRNGTPQDRCLEELFKAVDTAKTLRRSLRGEDTSHRDNRKRFIEFLSLEIPCASSLFELRDAERGVRSYSLCDLFYDMRCKIHENENLNAEEEVDYHIMVDWSVGQTYFATVQDGKAVLNGYFVWNRLREILAKFITGLQAVIDIKTKGSFSITIHPELGSIRPSRQSENADHS